MYVKYVRKWGFFLFKRKRGGRDFEDLLCSNMLMCFCDFYKIDLKSDFYGFNV